MRIAIDASFHMHGGGAVHLQNLLAAWRELGVAQEHRIMLLVREEHAAQFACPGVEIVSVCGNASSLGRFLFQQVGMSRLLERLQADVLFCPGNYMPLRCKAPVVVAFRNAAPFCSYVTSETVGLRKWLYYQGLRKMMELSARRAERVIFISEFFRDLFTSSFELPRARADVIYHGRDGLAEHLDSAIFKKMGIEQPFILSISHLYPYKNMPALIEGYALAKSELRARGLRLVLVGKAVDQAHFRKLESIVERHDLAGWVLMPGAVPHAQIPALTRNCEFFVFQSMCENCPNTLIEALAAGLPIACSDIGVMPEIAGDAAVYYDPQQPQEIAGALIRLAQDAELRADLSRRARERARKFPSWKQVGEMTLASLLRAAGVPAHAAAGGNS